MNSITQSLAGETVTTRLAMKMEDSLQAFAVRAACFIGELDVPYSEEFDGHDFGDGTANLFLFADDELVAGAIARLILLAESGEVPANARIAYAIYADEERSDWAYRPIYPAGARGFEIF